MTLLPPRLLGSVSVLMLGLWGGAVAAGDELPRLSVEAAATALVSPSPPLLVDVRGRSEAASASIPRAINAGSDPLAFRPDGTGSAVILIVPWPAEPSLVTGWRDRLEAFGYKVSILDGGFPAWKDAKLPIEERSEPQIRPGSLPFTIPRGLCESNTPAKVFQ